MLQYGLYFRENGIAVGEQKVKARIEDMKVCLALNDKKADQLRGRLLESKDNDITKKRKKNDTVIIAQSVHNRSLLLKNKTIIEYLLLLQHHSWW